MQPAVATGLANAAGFALDSHLSVIAGIILEEWEALAVDQGSFDFHLNLTIKGQMRQLMTSARAVMGLNVPAEAPTTIINNTTQPTSSTDPNPPGDLMMVSVGAIARQANESKVKLCSLAKVKEGKALYFQREGVQPKHCETPTREQFAIF